MMGGRPEGSSTTSNEAVTFTGILFAASVVLVASTFSLGASSAMVPRAVGVPLVVLLGGRLIRELVARRRPQAVGSAGQPGQKPDEVGAILWLLALPALSTVLGFVVGPAIYAFAWARYRADERIVVAVAVAAVTAVAILVLFVGLLRTTLPAGLLGVLM